MWEIRNKCRHMGTYKLGGEWLSIPVGAARTSEVEPSCGSVGVSWVKVLREPGGLPAKASAGNSPAPRQGNSISNSPAFSDESAKPSGNVSTGGEK